MFCKNCGKEIADGTKFCSFCGASQEDSEVKKAETPAPKNPNVSKKSRTVAALLAFLLGGIGVHRFYVGKTGTGILQIILTFCFGIGYIWALIDLIIILCGNFKDKEGLLISDWDPKY
jgi:TM2 domain-containing membrane protein YozV